MRDESAVAPAGRKLNEGPAVGIVEWFRPGEHERVEAAIAKLQALGIVHLRTGFSWADYCTEEGERWYDWLIPRLSGFFDLLPCFHYTPPSLSLDGTTAGPPQHPKSYADFLDAAVTRYGSQFEWVELWNEPNNLNDWNWHLDHEWRIFTTMVGGAAYWMKRRGKRTVLGGMCPTDPNWLALMGERGVLAYIDAVGLHGFPGTWSPHWQGWAGETKAVRDVLHRRNRVSQLWITEAGYSTWRHDEGQQIAAFVDLLDAPVARVYWYSFQDIDPERETQEGFHVDERHYHTGMVCADGSPKLLYRILRKWGADGARRQASHPVGAPSVRRSKPYILITGGAGFLGCNIASRLAQEGQQVLVFDSLMRDRVDENLNWLRSRFPQRVTAEVGDVRDFYALRDAARHASAVVHLAAQVAVTSSLSSPLDDFDVNARGTLSLLEALRRRSDPPPLLFASTNKVYGALLGPADTICDGERYEPRDAVLQTRGVDERRPLDLHTPYGCSKGAADQYVLDFARVFGVPTVVFRMSCLYGPRQFGTEDQGWVAHFLISAATGQPITIYGDGRQVRDVLYVGDAVDAYVRALQRIATVSGNAFNLGGGPGHAISLRELLSHIRDLTGRTPTVAFDEWRPGDQLWYVSDTRKLEAATGWRARTSVPDGIGRLYRWLSDAFPSASESERVGSVLSHSGAVL